MKTTRHALACAALLLALAGCSRKHSAEEAVRQRLKDPDSARFGEFYYSSKTKRACLTVNAKNTLGGYTGNKQAELQRTKDGWDVLSDEEIAFDDCKAQWADSAEGAAQ